MSALFLWLGDLEKRGAMCCEPTLYRALSAVSNSYTYVVTCSDFEVSQVKDNNKNGSRFIQKGSTKNSRETHYHKQYQFNITVENFP